MAMQFRCRTVARTVTSTSGLHTSSGSLRPVHHTNAHLALPSPIPTNSSRLHLESAVKASHRPRTVRRQVKVCASWRNGNGPPSVPDRVVSALPYLLPLFDGLRYGKFLFLQFPTFAYVLAPFDPLIRVYFSVPFAGLIAFFAVYLGIINSPNFSRYVRFNAMQAVLLDVVLILPGLIESVLKLRPMGGPGLQLYITAYNTIFIFVFACVAFGVASCMAGRSAKLPIVGDAADAQIR